jgi:phosphomevalonate kinase
VNSTLPLYPLSLLSLSGNLELEIFLDHLLTLSSASSATLSKNPFIETALSYALTYISSILPRHLIKPTSVTILADNDYYSQPSPPSSVQTSPPTNTHSFTDFNVRLQDAHKTGLGSSAALVTAFTGALLSHYLPPSIFTLSSSSGRAKLHNLAQAAHCAAQGKVGSGFDVATAVYGTCVYRRFSPSMLSRLGEPGSYGFSIRVRNVVDDTDESQKWDTEISKGGVTIPKGMALVMCDVDCGSQTVGMVKKVLEWRKSDPEGSKKLWDELQACNEHLGNLLTSGSEGDFEGAFAAIREHIRDMGKRSGVPIEPPEQTELLDAVTKGVDGVAGGVVPGAGGYDAIVLLVKDDKETLEEIEKFLAKWSKEKNSNVKLLGTKGALEGTRMEDGGKYGSWVK